MFLVAVLLWVIGLLTVVPFGTYYLLFHAQRDEYALLITLVLFWIFGFWGVVGPLLGAIKAHRVFRAIEAAHSQGKLMEALRSRETQDVAIDLIASENHIPRFLAAWVYRLILNKLSASGGAVGNPPKTDGRDGPQA
jgi:hypothetical protein